MYNILVYKDKNGKSDIQEYMNTLKNNYNKNNRIKFTKITAYIRELKKNGLSLGEKYIKHISGEIWELRPIRDRIFFAYLENNNFILLHIFMKQTREDTQKGIRESKT